MSSSGSRQPSLVTPSLSTSGWRDSQKKSKEAVVESGEHVCGGSSSNREFYSYSPHVSGERVEELVALEQNIHSCVRGAGAE